MVRSTNFKLFLTFFFMALLLLITMDSCKIQKVLPISPEPPAEIIQPATIAGIILDNETSLGIENVAVSIALYSVVTNAEGRFEFEVEISPGTYTLTISKEGYITCIDQVTVEEGFSVNLSCSICKSCPPVTITPTDGGVIQGSTGDGQYATNIPPGAVSTTTQISVTPMIGTSSPYSQSAVQQNQAPAQSISLQPHGTTFNISVAMEAPQTLPTEYINGTPIVNRRNPDTGQIEVVGQATIENGKFKWDVTKGGEYYIHAPTNLVYSKTTENRATQIGTISRTDLPGTFKMVNNSVQSTIEAATGFSKNLLKTVFNFSESSTQVNYGVGKSSGANKAAIIYGVKEVATHTYRTTTGKIVARITQQGNQGNVENPGHAYIARWQYNPTHGNWIFIGYFRVVPNLSPDLYPQVPEAAARALGLPYPPTQPQGL